MVQSDELLHSHKTSPSIPLTPWSSPMAAPNNRNNRYNWVDPRGQFIGSTGMIFVDQTAADIYYQNYWLTAGTNQRIALVCTSWGMSMLYIQSGGRNQPAQVWAPRAALTNTIEVQDHGMQPPEGADMVPLDIRTVQAGAPGAWEVNNVVVGGLRMPWHRRIAVMRKNRKPLHYHQHEDRQGHEAHIVPDIKNQDDGAHYTFRKLVYGSQVSNYRRAELRV